MTVEGYTEELERAHRDVRRLQEQLARVDAALNWSATKLTRDEMIMRLQEARQSEEERPMINLPATGPRHPFGHLTPLGNVTDRRFLATGPTQAIPPEVDANPAVRSEWPRLAHIGRSPEMVEAGGIEPPDNDASARLANDSHPDGHPGIVATALPAPNRGGAP